MSHGETARRTRRQPIADAGPLTGEWMTTSLRSRHHLQQGLTDVRSVLPKAATTRHDGPDTHSNPFARQRRVGRASGNTLGLTVGVDGLTSPVIGIIADATSLRTALTPRRTKPCASTWCCWTRTPQPGFRSGSRAAANSEREVEAVCFAASTCTTWLGLPRILHKKPPNEMTSQCLQALRRSGAQVLRRFRRQCVR